MSEQNKLSKIVRQFGLTTWAVGNRTTVFFLTVILLFAGMGAYQDMPKEAFPEVTFPQIYVGTPYPGNAPEDIENLISRPLEKELNNVAGVKKITSNSVQDMSTIMIEFETDVVVSEALREVKDAVDNVKKDLPSDLETDPIVSDVDVGEVPIMFINLSGEYSKVQLKDYAEVIKDIIEDVDEISEVQIWGIEEQEVEINLDPHKMAAVELSFNDIANKIRGRNTTISAGTIKKNGFAQSIKVDGEIESPKELEELIVKHEKGNIVYLKDVIDSEIKLVPKEMESYASFEGQPVLRLDVIKKSGANLLSASDKINKILADIQSPDYKGALPSNLNYTLTNDQSDMTRAQVSNLENSIFSGVILVVGVLLFFLGTRNSLFVGMAIPMSMFLSFIILNSLGITINMMVLFALIMALGMLVDNGIVVVENIYRLMDEGLPPFQAAKEGVGEVAWPIISSTATTLAAFLPLAFWPGIMGEFMKFLPITLIIVLGSSLFVALVINPAFTAVFMKIGVGHVSRKKSTRAGLIWFAVGVLLVMAEKKALGNMLALYGLLTLLNIYILTPVSVRFQNSFLPRLERIYEGFLNFALKGRRPISFFIGTFILMFVSMFLYFGVFTPQTLFFPNNEPKYINVYVDMPLGTEINSTKDFALELESVVKGTLKSMDEDVNLPYDTCVKAVSTLVGKGTSDPADPAAGGGDVATPHKARINIEFKEYSLRAGVNTSHVLSKLQDTIRKRNYAGVRIAAEKDRAGPPAGKPVTIELTGDSYDTLITYSDSAMSIIRKATEDYPILKGIEELKPDLERGKPELVLNVDYRKASRLGIDASQIAMVLRSSIFGQEVSKFKEGEDEYDIQLRVASQYRNDVKSLVNQKVTFRDQSNGQIVQVPISAIAEVEYKPAFGAIRRKDLDRIVTLSSNVIDGYNATAIVEKLKEVMKDFKMPEGYNFKFAGEQEEQAKQMEFLSGALLTALFMILLIIVAQFNKISAPFVILTSVVLSTIGVFLGLMIFQMDFVVMMTMIGIISLAGVVVNNAIVLLDYAALTKDRMVDELGGDKSKFGKAELIKSIVYAGKTRLRPVLLTAVTTVLGLIPLATGLNIDFYGLVENYDPNITVGSENTIFWGPMSWTIIFGITFATFLTLVIVPVMYLGVERFKFYIYVKGGLYTSKSFGLWLIRPLWRLLSLISFGVINKPARRKTEI